VNPNPDNNYNYNQSDEFVFDTQRLIGMMWRYWYLFLISPIIGVIVALLYKRYETPKYTINSTILIRKKDNQGNGLKGANPFDMGSLFSSSASNVADEIEVLKSRTLMVDVIHALKINPTCYAEGRVKRTVFYKNGPITVDSFFVGSKPVALKVPIKVIDNEHFEATVRGKKIAGVFGESIVADSFSLKLRLNPNLTFGRKSYSIQFYEPDALASAYVKKIDVANVKVKGGGSSNAITLKMDDVIQERGIAVLNKLIDSYNNIGIEDKNAGDKAALKFITDRIATLTSELSGVEQNIANYKKQQNITVDAGSDIGYLFQRLGSGEEKIMEFEVKKSVLKMVGESFATQAIRNQYSLMPTTLVTETSNPSLHLQIQEYNKLIFDRDRLLKQVKASHPSVLVLEKQILQFNDNIQQDIKTAIQNMDNEVNASLDKFKAQNLAINKKLKETPQKERELLEIGRSKTIKENLYLFLLQKREETALALASTVANAKVLDAPTKSQAGGKSTPLTILIITVFLGILIPAVFFAVKIYLDDSIEKESDIKSVTGIPYIGFIAHNKDQSEIVMRKGNRSPIAETFRLLRSNLQFLMATASNKVISVTSSISGEGKSFITLNLGLSFAIAGKKTIVLGFDLRRPKLTSYLTEKQHKDSEVGLTNYLLGDVTVEQIIQKSELCPDLYFIASGPIPPNPAELMMQAATADLFKYLEANFDYVIVDNAPVGLVADALVLNEHVGVTLYITRANVTQKKQLRVIDTLCKEGKIKNPTILLNGVRAGKAYGYGHGYGYGYGYDVKKEKA
jgi:tyrosine-protein kinase Etk/Wzc